MKTNRSNKETEVYIALWLCLAICTSSGAVVKITTEEKTFECGSNITLTCYVKGNTHSVAWMNENDAIAITQCTRTSCKLNPDYEGQFKFSFDSVESFFNLTLLNVTEEHSGKKLICSDGQDSDSRTITIRNNDQSASNAMLTTYSDLGGDGSFRCNNKTVVACSIKQYERMSFMVDENVVAVCIYQICKTVAPNVHFSFDTMNGIFSLTMNPVTFNDNGKILKCNDSKISASLYVKVDENTCFTNSDMIPDGVKTTNHPDIGLIAQFVVLDIIVVGAVIIVCWLRKRKV